MVVALFFVRDRDLSDLAPLATTTATVVDRDHHAKSQDYVEVRFTPAGQAELQARIPSDTDTEVGEQLQVAYRTDDPTRVRTVDDWAPAWQLDLVTDSVFAVVGLPVLGFGLVSLLRHGRYEEGAPLPPAEIDDGLGTRIARSGHWIQAMWAGMGLVFGTGFIISGFLVDDELVLGLVFGAVFLVIMFGVAATYQWSQGRDGVWANDTELVVHRRAQERRWPWKQVLELGVVQDNRSISPAAKLDDGFADRVGPDGWVTLCRPVLGPVTAPVVTRRLEALAVEHGIPFTEGVAGTDVADTIFGPWSMPSRVPGQAGDGRHDRD